jgi:hypothetical protein
MLSQLVLAICQILETALGGKLELPKIIYHVYRLTLYFVIGSLSDLGDAAAETLFRKDVERKLGVKVCLGTLLNLYYFAVSLNSDPLIMQVSRACDSFFARDAHTNASHTLRTCLFSARVSMLRIP